MYGIQHIALNLINANQNCYKLSICILIWNVSKGKCANTVGEEDAMVAVFLAAYLKTNDYKESLREVPSFVSYTAFSSWIGKMELICVKKWN